MLCWGGMGTGSRRTERYVSGRRRAGCAHGGSSRQGSGGPVSLREGLTTLGESMCEVPKGHAEELGCKIVTVKEDLRVLFLYFLSVTETSDKT